MAYGNFKDLNRRTLADKELRDKAFEIAKDTDMMDINMNVNLWFINFLIKNFFCRNDSIRGRRVFKPQRVSKYIERLPTKFSCIGAEIT